MAEKKEKKPVQDYEAMVRARVATRAVSLSDTLYESVGKPSEEKKTNSGRGCLSDEVKKAADDTKKKE